MTAAAGPTSPDPGPSFWTVERWTYWDFWARSFDQPWDSHAPGWRANAAMLGRLERLDVATLTDEQRIDWAVAVDKCLRAVQALRTRALAIAAGAQRSDPATEVGVLTLAGQLQQSPTQTAHQVTFARQMVTTFPDTLAAVDHGAIPMSYARAVYDETAGLSAEQCSAVEQAVLAKAAGRKPYQHTAALRRAVRKVAPRPAPEDDGSPEQERDARLRESGPWSSGLWMQGPAEQMALIAARLAAATAVPRTEQDPRTMPQRRYDTILDALSAKTNVFVDLVGYANPDGTISLPSLPGIGDLDPDQLGRLITGGTLRFHNPQVKPPATDAYEWTAAQRRYVCARDRVCRFPGCQVPAERCELDHVIPFQPDGSRGATDVDNGIAICKRHHRVKHQPGWKIERFDDGTVVWTSPTGHTTTDQPWHALDDQ